MVGFVTSDSSFMQQPVVTLTVTHLRHKLGTHSKCFPVHITAILPEGTSLPVPWATSQCRCSQRGAHTAAQRGGGPQHWSTAQSRSHRYLLPPHPDVQQELMAPVSLVELSRIKNYKNNTTVSENAAFIIYNLSLKVFSSPYLLLLDFGFIFMIFMFCRSLRQSLRWFCLDLTGNYRKHCLNNLILNGMKRSFPALIRNHQDTSKVVTQHRLLPKLQISALDTGCV